MDQNIQKGERKDIRKFLDRTEKNIRKVNRKKKGKSRKKKLGKINKRKLQSATEENETKVKNKE